MRPWPALPRQSPHRISSRDELTGSSWLYTDNDEFFGGNELETTVNDVANYDEKSNLLFGPSFGWPISSAQSLRLTYVRNDTRTDVGADTHSFAVGWAFRF